MKIIAVLICDCIKIRPIITAIIINKRLFHFCRAKMNQQKLDLVNKYNKLSDFIVITLYLKPQWRNNVTFMSICSKQHIYILFESKYIPFILFIRRISFKIKSLISI